MSSADDFPYFVGAFDDVSDEVILLIVANKLGDVVYLDQCN